MVFVKKIIDVADGSSIFLMGITLLIAGVVGAIPFGDSISRSTPYQCVTSDDCEMLGTCVAGKCEWYGDFRHLPTLQLL